MTKVANQPSQEGAKPDFTPDLNQSAPQPSARELELQAIIDRQNSQIEDLQAVPTDKQAQAVHDLKKGFKVPKGEEDYTHVVETQVNGETVEPRSRPYDAHQYETLISKQQGYTAEIIHKGKK